MLKIFARVAAGGAMILMVAGLALAQGGAAPTKTGVWPGEQIFNANCAACHNGGSPKAPPLYSLRGMSPSTVLAIIDHGVMKEMAASLTPMERRQVVEYVTQTDLSAYKAPPPPKTCDPAHARFDLSRPVPAVGWGYDSSRFIPASVGGLTAANLPRLKLKWAFAFPDATQARSQPVVGMGAVFVGSHNGQVYALDLATGCVRWAFTAVAEVRTTIVVEPVVQTTGKDPSPAPRAFFGDVLGNVYAVNALTGKQIWRVHPEAHRAALITGSPVLWGRTLYVPVSSMETGAAEDPAYACCTFRGSVVALDVSTGGRKWQAYSVLEAPRVVGKTSVGTDIMAPSGAPVWGAPTVDTKRGLLYFGTGENYQSPADGGSDAVIAVDLRTGQRRWSHQLHTHDAWNNSCMYKDHPNCPAERGMDQDIASSVLIVRVANGRDILVAGSKSGVLAGLDPDHGGTELWRTRIGRGSLMGGIHFGMANEGTRIYVPLYESKVTPLAGTYGDRGFPGMAMVDANTGKLVWRGDFFDDCRDRKPCEPGISAAVTAVPGAVVAGHIDGWLRAYDSATGKVLWQTDTSKDFPSLNGTIAHGGSMSGPGPAIYQGNLIVNSGYGFAMKLPGNALLVYSLDGK